MKMFRLAILVVVMCLAVLAEPSLVKAATVTPAEGNLLDATMVGLGARILPIDNIPAFSNYCGTYEGKWDLEKTVAGTDRSCGTLKTAAVPQLYQQVAMMYKDPPASGQKYIASLFKQINPASQVYAQGFGFSALDPVLSLWKIFRDIAYLLLTVVFIFIGFAVMLRRRLNPQTVVSIQNSLPKLVVTLIIITFSYAIVGFMIDIMYLIIYFIVSIFQNQIFTAEADINRFAFQNNVITNMIEFVKPGSVSSDIAGQVGSLVENLVSTGISQVDTIIYAFSTGLMFVIVAFAILVQTLRVFFNLLTAYAMIILYVIFAPFVLLMNALPGTNTFSGWLKSVAANLMTFPIVIVLLLITKALTSNTVRDTLHSNSAGFIPPQIANTFSGNVASAQALIALAMIMAIPDIIKLAKERMGAKDLGLDKQTFAGLQSGAGWANRVMRTTFGASQQEKLEQEGRLRSLPGFGRFRWNH